MSNVCSMYVFLWNGWIKNIYAWIFGIFKCNTMQFNAVRYCGNGSKVVMERRASNCTFTFLWTFVYQSINNMCSNITTHRMHDYVLYVESVLNMWTKNNEDNNTKGFFICWIVFERFLRLFCCVMQVQNCSFISFPSLPLFFSFHLSFPEDPFFWCSWRNDARLLFFGADGLFWKRGGNKSS